MVVAGSTVEPKLALYSQQSYLSLLSARTIDVHYQVQPSKVYEYLFLEDEMIEALPSPDPCCSFYVGNALDYIKIHFIHIHLHKDTCNIHPQTQLTVLHLYYILQKF